MINERIAEHCPSCGMSIGHIQEIIDEAVRKALERKDEQVQN